MEQNKEIVERSITVKITDTYTPNPETGSTERDRTIHFESDGAIVAHDLLTAALFILEKTIKLTDRGGTVPFPLSTYMGVLHESMKLTKGRLEIQKNTTTTEE